MGYTCHCLSIGNELMLGDITNSNASYISKSLSVIGIKTTKQISIPDEPSVIIGSIKESLGQADIVMLTGGLGPTVDDLTLECIAKALDKRLIFKKKIAADIRGHFKKRGLKMPANNLRQAFMPEGALDISNRIGTAPGLIIPMGKKAVIALPGVPFEMRAMIEKGVLPYIKKKFRGRVLIRSRVIKTTGLSESRVNELIEDILKIKGSVQMGIYPHPEEITIKITVTEKTERKVASTVQKIEKRIKSRLGKFIFGYDDETLEQVAGRALLKSQKTVSTAESCTGGLLGNRLTDMPGSSAYFMMGVITYSDASKNNILGIPLKIIKKYGAVSEKTCALMAKNIRLLADTDIGIGISGIAGPGNYSKKKPVGLVCIAISTKKKAFCNKFNFTGQRDIIKYKATQAALDMLRRAL